MDVYIYPFFYFRHVEQVKAEREIFENKKPG